LAVKYLRQKLFGEPDRGKLASHSLFLGGVPRAELIPGEMKIYKIAEASEYWIRIIFP
jgi:hypothetical protein